ncbi:MarR family winged helix-turn-helix transcriptional regulator [Micromonospora sp. WMMD1120]|uniref:MarR family winged helix-turn-helix transcriptional regulator n=1 Tax=Micromonospora sp. WMMD1120 TaxID=3016106 RepID=UPI002416AA25|nr:MarR family winged helix-turn-helix transcriptional regulator [Micromonospora sp. WMMD1120]MDG4810369.1 MarR family winged helix-turn-helix transcriptional regulator [Micromonospora sp. WMMD1120]
MIAHTAEGADDESLAETFWAVASRLRRQTRDALAPWEITPSQSRALGVLARHGEVRPGTLAEHLRIAPRSATEVIDDLQTRGLVERRADPTDRRATLVALTAEGERLAAAIRTARRAEADRFFGHLGDGDRAELARILRTLRG